MPRRKTIPGSIYVPAGRTKLRIKFKGMTYSTGLEDTKEGRELAKKMLEQLYLEDKGIAPKVRKQPEGIRLDDAFDEFLAVHCTNKTQGTKDNFLAAFKAIARVNYILTVADVEADILHYLASTTQSPYTINNYLARFQTFLNFCTERGWLPQTNFARKHSKRGIEILPQVWEQEEIEKIVAYFNGRDREYAIMIQFMLHTGARIVDCLTLEWEQVRGDVIHWKNKIKKTYEARPITENVRILLEELPHDRTKVFRWEYGAKSRIIRRFNDALETLQIPKNGRGLQEMRVTFRNTLLDAGIQPEVAQHLMRHQDLRTTLKHYTALNKETLQKELKKVDFGTIQVPQEKER